MQVDTVKWKCWETKWATAKKKKKTSIDNGSRAFLIHRSSSDVLDFNVKHFIIIDTALMLNIELKHTVKTGRAHKAKHRLATTSVTQHKRESVPPHHPKKKKVRSHYALLRTRIKSLDGFYGISALLDSTQWRRKETQKGSAACW